MTTTSFSVPTGDSFPATLQFVDSFGNVGVAPSGETPVWASANTQILTVTAAADGMSATIVTVGPTGTDNVTVTDGTLTGILEVTVIAGAVTQITVVPGTPVPNTPSA